MITICDYCGKTIRKRPAVIENQDHVFCDQQCSGHYIGLHRTNNTGRDLTAYNKIRKLAKLYKANLGTK